MRLDVDPDKADVASRGPLFKEPYNTRLVLTDGGVYDNLGLEPVFKRYRTVLVSDGGAPMQSVPYPSGLWPLQLLRVIGTMQTQVEARRKIELIDRFQMRTRAAEFRLDEQSPVLREFGRSGAFSGIATDPGKFSDNPLGVTQDTVSALARTPTRLKALCPTAQE